MNIAPSIDNMLLFMLLVVPGLISIHIYRLLMPTKDVDWKNALTEALFYSALNFAVLLPLLIPINRGTFPTDHPTLYPVLMLIPFLGTPILWPIIISKILKSNFFMKKLQRPYPTAWDYFFDKREPAFVLVHLKNGSMIGGFYGEDSYSTSFPRHGAMYLQTVIKVNEEGAFISVIEGSKGMLIEKESYEYVEFFELPTETGEEQ